MLVMKSTAAALKALRWSSPRVVATRGNTSALCLQGAHQDPSWRKGSWGPGASLVNSEALFCNVVFAIMLHVACGLVH